MSNQHFEHIIKEKFENASSNVPASAWAEVYSQVSGSASTSGFFTSVLGKVAAGVILVAVSAVIVLNLPDEGSKETIHNTEVIKEDSSAQEKTETPQLTFPEKDNTVTPKENEQKLISESSINQNFKIKEEAEKPIEDINEKVQEDLKQRLVDQSDRIKLTAKEPSGVNIIDAAVEDNEKIMTPVVPSKILSAQLDPKSAVYSFELDQSSSSQRINWYVNDVLASDNKSFTNEFSSAGEFTIMARVYNEKNELVITLFQNENITLEPVLFVPNTFTPQSSSGYNDVFDIDSEKSENIPWYEIFIFNVEGSLIFKSNDAQKGWNGLDVNQNLASEGAYIYVVNYKSESGETYSERGKVILQR